MVYSHSPDFSIESWSKSEFPLVKMPFYTDGNKLFSKHMKNSLLPLSPANDACYNSDGFSKHNRGHRWINHNPWSWMIYWTLRSECTILPSLLHAGGPRRGVFEWMMWKHSVCFSSTLWPLVSLMPFEFLDLIFSHIHSIPYIFT